MFLCVGVVVVVVGCVMGRRSGVLCFSFKTFCKLLYKVLFDDDDDFVAELGTQHIVCGNGAKLLYF